LAGPAGAGKSELLRALRSDPATLFFRVGREHATFARFVHGLARTIAAVAPGAQASFPRVWERALQAGSPHTVLAHWLCEHLHDSDHRLVLDDLHDAASDPSIASFIAKLVEARDGARLTIALRTAGLLPTALWMATRRMEAPIDEAALRFTPSEAADAARMFGVHAGAADMCALLESTGGSAIALTYALTRLRADPRAFLHTPAPAGFNDIAAAIFARRTGAQRAFLLSAALYPAIEDDVLALAGWDDAADIRSTMRDDAPFMWAPGLGASLHFHDRFRDYLMAQFAACDADFRSTIARRTVRTLREAGRPAAALDVATRQGLAGAMAELLDAHGFEMLESGQLDVISNALTALESPDGALGARATALRGYLDARCGRLDTSEAWFRLSLASAQDEPSRVAIAMYYSDELARRRREDACEVLAPFADSPTLPRATLIDVRSSYAQALTAANRLDEARALTDTALAMLEPDSPQALRARVFARAAYVAIENGLLRLARERAEIAAPLAIAESLYAVAASTYSVLYSVAYAEDDAIACLASLHQVRDLGVKSGNVRLDLYALLGMFELHAEAGNEREMTELDRQLGAIDKHDATVEMMEALLPGKALQAGWTGNFAAAAQLLRPTAEHHATNERRALCWAQIGVYAAADGDLERAADAAQRAQAALAQVDAPTTLFELTLLTLALAAWTGGDLAGAWHWINAADRADGYAAPRLRALRAAVAALVQGTLDAEPFEAPVSAALTELRAAAFGGYARLIEALPYRGAAPEADSRTVGGVLAAYELAGRFAAAVAQADPDGLRAWLDALPAAIVSQLSLVSAFDEWAAQRLRHDARPPQAFGRLRSRLAAYHVPAPAILRLVDDIDESIDKLFEHLDAAAPLMAEHSRAVSAWCSRIARALDLDEAHIEFVTRCGLIHDVGKMRTPPEILNAPRGLSDNEWAIMRDHAAVGGRIVAARDRLAPFVPIVRSHHERLDGKGYPDGLRTTAIPLAARIVSVADSFNAMIGRRAYRLPLPPTEALDELDRNRGTQFDPEIVAAMIRIVEGRIAELPTG
jgi:putative nucleotidyltransferase with HDIG domain